MTALQPSTTLKVGRLSPGNQSDMGGLPNNHGGGVGASFKPFSPLASVATLPSSSRFAEGISERLAHLTG